MRSNQAELKNAVHAMQSKLDALTARVNEAEKIINDLEDGLMERKEKVGTWLKKLLFQECDYGRLLTQ